MHNLLAYFESFSCINAYIFKELLGHKNPAPSDKALATTSHLYRLFYKYVQYIPSTALAVLVSSDIRNTPLEL
jgi:hypothetical protein